jgi:heme/copper-type cytochrome/quinol oxidase subunit 2
VSPARKTILLAALIAMAAAPSAFACATCYGASDSPLAQGMNWGIMVLLGFIGAVLVGVSSFFVYIVRRASAMEAVAAQNNSTQTKQ